MKLRIQDNSVRIRIVPQELAQLVATGRIESVTEIYRDNGGLDGRFVFGVASATPGAQSHCEIASESIVIYLSESDLKRLAYSDAEGVYLRKETVLPTGAKHRFLAYVEKDRLPEKTGEKSRPTETPPYETQ